MTDTLDIFVDAVTRASVFKCADIAAPGDTPIATMAISNTATRRCLPTPASALFRSIAQLLTAAVAEKCASFSFREHSSQQTSTVLPPILTLMGFSSSLQSQAAQVFSTMTSLSNTRKSG